MAMIDGQFEEVIKGIACATELAGWLSSRAKENTLDGAMLNRLVDELCIVRRTLDDCIQDCIQAGIQSIDKRGSDKGKKIFKDLLKQYGENANVE